MGWVRFYKSYPTQLNGHPNYREIIPGSTIIERRGRKKIAKGIYIPEEIDNLAWYRFAALAHQLGFTSISIISLKSLNKATTEILSEQAKPSFVTTGSSKAEERRSGRPYNQEYKQSQRSLFPINIYNTDKCQGCGITPFFIRRSIYLAFLGYLLFGGLTAASIPATEESPL